VLFWEGEFAGNFQWGVSYFSCVRTISLFVDKFEVSGKKAAPHNRFLLRAETGKKRGGTCWVASLRAIG
jgi:hypothetical protein